MIMQKLKLSTKWVLFVCKLGIITATTANQKQLQLTIDSYCRTEWE